MMYPFSKQLQEASRDFQNGNFGLWFDKMVPLDEKTFKACAPRGEKNVQLFYKKKYDLTKNGVALKILLEKRHEDQQRFCRVHSENGAKVIEIKAKLKSALITGIGKTHPGEVAMTFDHTMGIPYLPATGIKGLTKLAHILNLIEAPETADTLVDGDFLKDDHPDSLIPAMFGGDIEISDRIEKRMGKVIFLDAYPENVPNLHLDIMNPHYGDYYSDDAADVPPADYLAPVPIQFLTVNPGEVIVFRAIVMDDAPLYAPLVKAFHRALTEIGLGAKTAVGYGRFGICDTAPVKTASNHGSNIKKPEIPLERREWEKVTLTFSPGNLEIKATSIEGTATVIGKDIVPETYHARLFGKKKKATPQKVTVEKVGNAWRIIEII